jgi:DTW domain-containing protein YfiP
MSTDPRCSGCFLKPALCMCALLPSIATRTRVALALHKMEHGKSTNTGRLAARCLQSCEVFAFGYDLPVLPARVWPEGHTPVVLFPLASAKPIADFRGQDKLCLIVLDANWRAANRMRKRFAEQNIPFASCPPTSSIYRLRAEPSATGLSTLEAIAAALQALEGGSVQAELLQALRVFQDRTLWLRGSLDRKDVEGGIPLGVERHLPM